MADEAKAPAVADAVKATDDATQPLDTPTESAVAEEKQTNGGDAAASEEVNKDAEPSSPKQDPSPPVESDIPERPKEVTEPLNGTTTAATPVKENRRKSATGVPEHKKKTPGKKKAAPELRLNVQPGEMYMVSMRGYPPWPVIVCDEDMLPETLLSKRPVSAKRIDGTYRADFAEGGKHAKDRRYPIMFLGTNEFAWEINTALQPVTIDDIKAEIEAGNNGKKKKAKALWEAYQVAAKGHDLQYFKNLLANHEEAMQLDAVEKTAADAQKQEPKDKKKRKSSAAVVDEDVDMDEDAEEEPSEKKSKQTKKRKKGDDSDGEPEKPVKTPKTKLKLTNKPKAASATKPVETKAKKTKAKGESAESESAKPEEKPMTEAERREKQEKSVLYLRHRLQKGFLARDHPPLEVEMGTMSEYLKQLEDIENLEAEAIKKTKVHKVLKAIVKLASIPKEEQYNFKKRSTDLLQRWSGALQAEDASADPSTAPTTSSTKTNGIATEEKKDHEDKEDQKKDDEIEKDEKRDDKEAEKKEDVVAPAAKADNAEQSPSEVDATKATDADGDVSMTDAKPEAVVAVAADEDKEKTSLEAVVDA